LGADPSTTGSWPSATTERPSAFKASLLLNPEKDAALSDPAGVAAAAADAPATIIDTPTAGAIRLISQRLDFFISRAPRLSLAARLCTAGRSIHRANVCPRPTPQAIREERESLKSSVLLCTRPGLCKGWPPIERRRRCESANGSMGRQGCCHRLLSTKARPCALIGPEDRTTIP